jgi:energy-coupling factor transporter ATP-binding protein EcfA2
LLVYYCISALVREILNIGILGGRLMDINSVSSIRIQNAYFNQSETLQLFNKGKKTIQICLLYGKNGSGKTTISRAFQKIAGKEISQIDSADLLDNRGVSISTDQSSLPISALSRHMLHIRNGEVV